jgi:hypothetical protein
MPQVVKPKRDLVKNPLPVHLAGFDEENFQFVSKKRTTEQPHIPDKKDDRPMRPFIKGIETAGGKPITDVLTQEPLKKLEETY